MAGYNENYRRMSIDQVAKIVAYVINGYARHDIPFNELDIGFVLGGAAVRDRFAFVSEGAYAAIKRNAPRRIVVDGERELGINYLENSWIRGEHPRLIIEHVVPRAVLKEGLIAKAKDHELTASECAEFLRAYAKVGLVIKDDDDRLTACGLKSCMPEGWNWAPGEVFARYVKAEIKEHVF